MRTFARADVAWTWQTLDKDGMVLNMSQTWHQVRPGEVRTNCGGCHAHSQKSTAFEKTAAALPNRIGAGASFHGGGLVTGNPDSPHLLAPKIKARMYFGIASNDDARQPDAKDKLKEAFAAAKVPAEIEVYPGTLHGWCVPDMPARDGMPIYNKPEAERAWAKLVALYKAALG